MERIENYGEFGSFPIYGGKVQANREKLGQK